MHCRTAEAACVACGVRVLLHLVQVLACILLGIPNNMTSKRAVFPGPDRSVDAWRPKGYRTAKYASDWKRTLSIFVAARRASPTQRN
ncbi:hypothetical protein B0H19DRAFT_487110 [Mycena capillaripes]|nr:hypothetical protein B0H19DRAFT_487110 [Mycena capillaripes]